MSAALSTSTRLTPGGEAQLQGPAMTVTMTVPALAQVSAEP